MTDPDRPTPAEAAAQFARMQANAAPLFAALVGRQMRAEGDLTEAELDALFGPAPDPDPAPSPFDDDPYAWVDDYDPGDRQAFHAAVTRYRRP